MTAHRLTIQAGSLTVYGLAFDSEAELEAFLVGRPPIEAPPSPQAIKPERPRGRPALDSTITAAVAALGSKLNPHLGLAARARLVLGQIATVTTDASSIPSRRTVENFLADRPVRNKSGNKYGNKSARVTIARNRRS